MAANNPLSPIRATAYDEKSGDIRTEACVEGGENLASVHNGEWVVYEDFDFDSGVAAFKARFASVREGKIEVRLDQVDGPLLGVAEFDSTGGWQKWDDIAVNVDNSQAGVRDVYLVFRGYTQSALVNLSEFTFLKSTVLENRATNMSLRLDEVDDEPQATQSWGVPETGFRDDFTAGLTHWNVHHMEIREAGGTPFMVSSDEELAFAVTPDVYINKTDTGGEWRTLAQATLSVRLMADSEKSRPGFGFASRDGERAVFVTLNPEKNTLEAYRKTQGGELKLIHSHPRKPSEQDWRLKVGTLYDVRMDWSPYSNGMIVYLRESSGALITSFRTVIDLPAARRPFLISQGGPAKFSQVRFDPTLDHWNFKWEWKKEPILASDVCNPAVWKGTDGSFYMVWRKFGHDTFHGTATSTDGVHWTRLHDELLKCTGDMNVLRDPFGDGHVWITGGSANQPWWRSDESSRFVEWEETGKDLGDIHGNNRIQEFIDTARHPELAPIRLRGKNYRFIGYCENWEDEPKPHTVVLLSNTLTDWVLADPEPILPPRDDFWGEKGNALGSAFVLPDGNILTAICACTFDGYTGASEPSNISAIYDGKEPWKRLRLGTLPDAPVSKEGTWYEGPNFGTAYLYDDQSDTLFFYGGFHDYFVGMMRVRNFLQTYYPESYQNRSGSR
ncbi:hypothetical protein HNR46_002217 [Haloferula luteola]|uniref:CBM6 domain-containing protein n=1 Tax=Haloferula luteola TaxID=595692 RepID=A0A840V4K4_9BACT|nr:carbohydrate-binding protein [Haloferula luteola]MBB5351976.1 hypothetical protein [Haloferula luteola]